MLGVMKQRLAPAMQQHLVLTPQLRQAIRLLQLSAVELEAEVAEAVASNPLLDWQDPASGDDGAPDAMPGTEPPADDPPAGPDDRWDADEAAPLPSGSRRADENEGDTPAAEETLQDHLLWQLHLNHFSPRDTRLGIALVEAIGDDGYLREDLDALAEGLRPDLDATRDDLLPVLHRIQQFDPVGVGARDLGECLRLQLQALPADTPGRATALAIADGPLPQLPRLGIPGLCATLGCTPEAADTAVQLLRTLEPRPGARYGALPAGSYVTPDCVVWRQQGQWRVALAGGALPRVALQQDYQRLLARASGSDADYLRGHLQEARWLLKGLAARADTLLRVVRRLVDEQAAFLDFGPQALRPLTLRDVAAALGLHESTVSRAIARKYVRTPRGTLALRDFFASGIDTDGGGSTSSTAIQDRIRQLVAAEDPRKPLSDARLAATLKAEGVPVARRTVAKYREALRIPASHERVRIG